MEPQTAYSNPALWTVYHTIDSEVPTPRQAWQMAAERLAVLQHVPIHGEGVPNGVSPNDGLYMLSCSDWLPYMWSLNLLLLAENSHMALALWQTGMREEAYRIFKGALLDSMYMGLCPGDFHMTSALDVHRQEAQRDFGDPIGIASRALVEGLFGVQPNLIANEIRIRPGFPRGWNRASLKHKDFDLAWRRDGLRETIEFTSRLAKAVPLTLTFPPAPPVFPPWFATESAWTARLSGPQSERRCWPSGCRRRGQTMSPSSGLATRRHSRPRSAAIVSASRSSCRGALTPRRWMTRSDALTDGRITSPGFHTVFANMRQGDCTWSLPISFEAKASPLLCAVPRNARRCSGRAGRSLPGAQGSHHRDIHPHLCRAAFSVLLACLP